MRAGWVVLVGGAIAAPPGLGQVPSGEEPAFKGLAELLRTPVVTASRTPKSARSAPATVVIVTAEQIRLRRYRSLWDVLKDLPEIKGDPGSDFYGFNGLTVRGVQGLQKLLILMDGMRISGPTNEPVPFLENYPVQMVRQVEVVFGPASALYGADAFSGVVNLITQGQEAEAGESIVAAGGQWGLGFGQASARVHLGIDTSLLFAAQAFWEDPPDLASYDPDRFGGTALLKTGAFETPGGGTQTPMTPWEDHYGAPLQASALWLKLHSGEFAATLFHRYGKTTSNAGNDPRFAIYNGSVFLGTEQTTLQGTHTFSHAWGEATTSATLSRYELNPHSNYRNALTGEEPGFEYAFSQTARMEEQVNWRPWSAFEWSAGLFLEHQVADVKTPDLASPLDDHGPLQGRLLGTTLPATLYSLQGVLWGAHFEAEWTPSEQWSFTAGLRSDHHSRYGGSNTPRLGAVWTPNERLTMKALAGRAFLAPSPQDTYNAYGSWTAQPGGGYASAFWHLPNPGLRPQKVDMEEMNLHLLLTDHLALRADAFVAHLRDLFSAGQDGVHTQLYNGTFMGYPVAYIEVPINLGTQRNEGGSLGLEWSSPWRGGRKVSATASVAFVDGRVDPRGDGHTQPIPFVAPWTFRLGSDVEGRAWSAHASFLWSGPQRKDLDPALPGQTQGLPGYRMLDLVLNLRPMRAWEGFLRIDNALDARWRAVGGYSPIGLDGVPQNPRAISVGIERKF
jgi:outer membrane cobalamin receptor